MCGALAIRPPSASKTAQEKSRRSLMLTEWAVDWRRTPICSATDMNRLLKISRSTGIGFGAGVLLVRPGRHAFEEQVAAFGDEGAPAGLDHGGGQFLGDDRRSGDGVPGLEAAPFGQIDLGPGSAGEQGHAGGRLGPFFFRTGLAFCGLAGFLLGSADPDGQSLDGYRLDQDRLVAHEEGEAAGVLGLERCGHLGERRDRDDDGGVGALVAQVRPVGNGDPVRRHALGFDLGAGVVFEGPDRGGYGFQAFFGQGGLDRLLAHGDDVGQPDPVGGQHAGQRVDEDLA